MSKVSQYNDSQYMCYVHIYDHINTYMCRHISCYTVIKLLRSLFYISISIWKY